MYLFINVYSGIHLGVVVRPMHATPNVMDVMEHSFLVIANKESISDQSDRAGEQVCK